MSLQGTIVPGRLRLELSPWGVKQFIDTFTLRFLNLLHSLVNISYMSLYVHISRPVLFMVQC